MREPSLVLATSAQRASFAEDPHLAERIERAIVNLADAGYVKLECYDPVDGRNDAMAALCAVVRTSLVEPMIPLTPQQRAQRVVDRWMARWGRIPSAETVVRDLTETIAADREEIARHAETAG